MKIANVSHRFIGFTFVRLFRLTVDAETGAYSLDLELSDSEHQAAAGLVASFHDVSKLGLREFGGGWTQILHIAVEDCSENQWDRVRFRVHDLENGVLFFQCKQIVIEDK